MRVEDYQWNPQERDLEEIRPNQLIATRLLGVGFVCRIIFVMGLRQNGYIYGRELYNISENNIDKLNRDGIIEIDSFEMIYFEKQCYDTPGSSLRMVGDNSNIKVTRKGNKLKIFLEGDAKLTLESRKII